MIALTAEPLELVLTEPFLTGAATTHKVTQIIVTALWGRETGYGPILVPKAVDGALERALSAVNLLGGFQARPEAAFLLEANQELENLFPDEPHVRSGIEIALTDLVGKVLGHSAREFFSLPHSLLPPTGLTLGLMDLETFVARAKILSAWPLLKIKLASPGNVRHVEALRGVYSGRIIVDGNGALDPDSALWVARRLDSLGVELFEQPLPAGQTEDLRRLNALSPIALAADEDCMGFPDFERLEGCVSTVNLKIFRFGGLRALYQGILEARARGFRVMLGCKTESVLGTTAVSMLGALAHDLDLDGHLDLVDDPFRGIGIADGKIVPTRGFGLGLSLA